MAKNPELHLLHNHDHQASLVADLDRALEAWSGVEAAEEADLSPLDEAREIVSLLKEDTTAHFEREEHGLFPNLKADYPELASELDRCQRQHDEICNHLERLEAMLESAFDSEPLENRALAVAAGKHLGELYWQHTAVEWGLIRNLLEKLDDKRRTLIMNQLREI